VELLVVIGIIALLVGILIPVLARAREHARAVQCASNISQIYKACVMYANDNRGVLPIPGGRESDLTPVGLAICGVRLEEWGRLNFREGTLWPYLAADLNARQELFLCPSDEPPRFARNYILPEADPDRPRNFSYTFTNFMAEGLRLSRIRRAPQKILILEQDMPRAPLGFPFTGYTASNPGDPPGPRSLCS
jgi:hypothetical protein